MSQRRWPAASPGAFDILINNAGINGAALDLDEEAWDRVIDTNLKGAFVLAQTVARAMRRSGRGGTIVLTKALALGWARDGIRVNALCPGDIETDIKSKFLASEAGRNSTCSCAPVPAGNQVSSL